MIGFAVAPLALLAHAQPAPPGAAHTAPPAGGDLLAVDALLDIAPTPSPDADIDDDGVILTELDAWLAPRATAKALHDVLAAEHAAIACSTPGFFELTLRVPRAATHDAMLVTAQRLQATGVFKLVVLAQTQVAPKALDRKTPYDAAKVQAAFAALRTELRGAELGCRVDTDCSMVELAASCRHFVVVRGPAANRAPKLAAAIARATAAARTIPGDFDCADGLPRGLKLACRAAEGQQRCVALDPRSGRMAALGYPDQVFGYDPPLRIDVPAPAIGGPHGAITTHLRMDDQRKLEAAAAAAAVSHQDALRACMRDATARTTIFIMVELPDNTVTVAGDDVDAKALDCARRVGRAIPFAGALAGAPPIQVVVRADAVAIDPLAP